MQSWSWVIRFSRRGQRWKSPDTRTSVSGWTQTLAKHLSPTRLMTRSRAPHISTSWQTTSSSPAAMTMQCLLRRVNNEVPKRWTFPSLTVMSLRIARPPQSAFDTSMRRERCSTRCSRPTCRHGLRRQPASSPPGSRWLRATSKPRANSWHPLLRAMSLQGCGVSISLWRRSCGRSKAIERPRATPLPRRKRRLDLWMSPSLHPSLARWLLVLEGSAPPRCSKPALGSLARVPATRWLRPIAPIQNS